MIMIAVITVPEISGKSIVSLKGKYEFVEYR